MKKTTYQVKIDVHSIPITALWGKSEWCKASDVVHLSRCICAMYHVLQSIKGKKELDANDISSIKDAIEIASEVML